MNTLDYTYHVRVVTTHPSEEIADEFLSFLEKGHLERFLTSVPDIVPRVRVVQVDPKGDNPYDSTRQIEIHYQFKDKESFIRYTQSDFAKTIRREFEPFMQRGVGVSRVTGHSYFESKI